MPPRSLNSPDGEQQEEYSTLLVWLHNQVQTGESSEETACSTSNSLHQSLRRQESPPPEEHREDLAL